MGVLVDGVFEGCEGAADFDFGRWFVSVEEGPEEAVLEFGVEDGDADAFVGEVVGVAVGLALDQAV